MIRSWSRVNKKIAGGKCQGNTSGIDLALETNETFDAKLTRSLPVDLHPIFWAADDPEEELFSSITEQSGGCEELAHSFLDRVLRCERSRVADDSPTRREPEVMLCFFHGWKILEEREI